MLFTVGEPVSLEGVVINNEEVFRQELGLLKGMEVRIQIDAEVTLKLCKTQPVPYAMKEKETTADLLSEQKRIQKRN